MRVTLFLLALCTMSACTLPEVEDQAPGTCSDGADSDLDGWIDCVDPDCAQSEECLAFAPASEEPPRAPDTETIWELRDGTFNSGAPLTGYFIYDSDRDQVLDWSLCVGGEGGTWDAMVYETTTSSGSWMDYFGAFVFNGDEVVGPYSNSYRSLRLGNGLEYAAPGELGEERSLIGSTECINCAPSRWVTGGVMVAVDVVPEACE